MFNATQVKFSVQMYKIQKVNENLFVNLKNQLQIQALLDYHAPYVWSRHVATWHNQQPMPSFRYKFAFLLATTKQVSIAAAGRNGSIYFCFLNFK